MPQIIQDDLGEDVEVFTQEELDAQVAEKNTELEKAQADLAAREEELGKLKDKDTNFAALREQKDAAEARVNDMTKEIEAQVGKAKNEILEGVLKDHFTETLKSLTGDDEELRKKVEHHYGRIADAASTKEAVASKLRDAYILAATPEDKDVLNTTVLSSGGVSRVQFPGSNQKFSAEEKAFAQKLAEAGGLGTLDEKDFTY